jgi:hypothetical protein
MRLNLKSTIVLAVMSLLSVQPTISQTSSPPKTLKTVTGYYRIRQAETPNTLEVLQLPEGRLQFHLLALWVGANNQNVHNGDLEGVVDLTGNTATYEREGCKVTMRFFSSSAIVTQNSKIGDCDFGVNVTASGTYRKLNSRKPKFSSQTMASKHSIQNREL